MKKRVIVYICLTAMMFGTMEVACKLAGNGLDSFQITFLRFVISAIVLTPAALREKKEWRIVISKGDYAYLLLLGIIFIPVSMVLFQIGIMECNASTAAILFSVNPVFTMIFAHFASNENMNGTKAVAIALTLIAMLFMIRPWDMQAGNTVPGILATLFSALTFGIYTVMGKKANHKVGVFVQTTISFYLGSAVLLVIMIIAGRPVLAGVLDDWALLLYVSIFVTGLGYLSYFLAIKYSDASTGSIAFLLKPVIAPIIAVIVLGESIIWSTTMGIALLVVASAINFRSGKNAALGVKNEGRQVKR